MTASAGPIAPGFPPDLLHKVAFDLCIALAYSWGGPVHLYSANPFHAAELALRLEDFPQGRRNRRPSLLLWAEPRIEDLPEVADLLNDFLPRSAVLLLFARRPRGVRGPGSLGIAQNRFCAKEMARAETHQHIARPKEVLGWLATRGFLEEARYGIGGPEYRFWSRLACLAEWLGRKDQSDRLRARARSVLLVRGEEALSAILTLVLTVRRHR